MDDDTARRIRLALSVIPLVVVGAVLAMTVYSIALPSGELLEISESDAIYISGDGAYITIDGSYEVTSRLRCPVDDLRIGIRLVDDAHGSSMMLWESGRIDLEPGRIAVVDVGSELFAPTLYLILSDLMSEDGSPITVHVTATCSYLWGLADVRVDSVLSMPLADPDGRVSYDASSDGGCLSVRIDGFREGLVPDPMGYVVSHTGGTISLDVSVDDGTVLVSLTSDDLPGSLSTLRESAMDGGFTVMDDEGRIVDVDNGTMAMLADIAGYLVEAVD